MTDLSGNRAPASEVTRWLLAWGNGDQAALDRLVPLVDAELHRIARRYIRKERSGHTLEPTALVNEAYLRLIEWKSVDWQNRAHFFAGGGQDNAAHPGEACDPAPSRIGDTCVITLPISPFPAAGRSMDILALDQALHKLAEFDERKCRLVEMRFFGGLTEEETAEAMASSLRTVQREWSIARAWLFRELSGPRTA